MDHHLFLSLVVLLKYRFIFFLNQLVILDCTDSTSYTEAEFELDLCVGALKWYWFKTGNLMLRVPSWKLVHIINTKVSQASSIHSNLVEQKRTSCSLPATASLALVSSMANINHYRKYSPISTGLQNVYPFYKEFYKSLGGAAD